MTPLQKPVHKMLRTVMRQKTMLWLHLRHPLVGEKRTKCSYENLWVVTASQRSSTNPLPESFQAIHWKIYVEEKTKRIKSNNTRCYAE